MQSMILGFENCIQSSLITSLVPKESHRIMFGGAPGWVLCSVSIFSGRHVQATVRVGTRTRHFYSSSRRSRLSITPVFPLVIKLTFMEKSESWWGFREAKVTRERHRMIGIVDARSVFL